MSVVFVGNGTYMVPNNVFSVFVMVIGAQGGPSLTSEHTTSPGFGSNITGIISVQPGNIFNITVGSKGQTGKFGSVGGQPGGGRGHLSQIGVYCSGSGGGGYSSIESNGTVFILAGGGGGSGGTGVIISDHTETMANGTNGGFSGLKPNDYPGLNGGDVSKLWSSGGRGGRLDHPGSGGQCQWKEGTQGSNGRNTFGGDGGNQIVSGCVTDRFCVSCGGGGGGGGGWFGGGGGAGGWFNGGEPGKTCSGSGGGGGSSFVNLEKVKLVLSSVANSEVEPSVWIKVM